MTLDDLARRYGTDKSSLRHDYCRVYQRYFPRPEAARAVLELGVDRGASLRMWRDFFPAAAIVGVDLRPPRLDLGERIAVCRADATNAIALHDAVDRYAPFDLVVDDASHVLPAMMAGFAMLWDAVAPGGFYAIEDVCCAYWPEYARGASLASWLADKIDAVNLHGARRHGLARRYEAIAAANELGPLERTLAAVHAHNSLLLFERRER